MSALVVVLVVAAVLVVAGVAGVAIRQRQGFAAANEVVPGVASGAPSSWAGAHTPEARLHRRLRDAVAALRAGSGQAAELAGARARLEQQALAVDERLVAVAALPERLRAEPLADVAAAVDAVEEAAASIVRAGPSLALEAGGGIDALLAELNERVALLAEARAELEGGTAGEGTAPA